MPGAHSAVFLLPLTRLKQPLLHLLVVLLQPLNSASNKTLLKIPQQAEPVEQLLLHPQLSYLSLHACQLHFLAVDQIILLLVISVKEAQELVSITKNSML